MLLYFLKKFSRDFSSCKKFDGISYISVIQKFEIAFRRFLSDPSGEELANVGSFLRPIARKYKKDPTRIYGFIVDRRSRKRKQENLVLSILAALVYLLLWLITPFIKHKDVKK